MKKRIFSSALIATMVASTLLSAGPAPLSASVDEGSSFDPGIVNQDRMIQALIRRGIIQEGLSPEQQEAVLNKYLQRRAKSDGSQAYKLSNSYSTMKLKSAMTTASVSVDSSAGKGGKNGKGSTADTSALTGAEAAAWGGGVRKDKILALLIEYSDFAHNNITPEETDFYYGNYAKQHYEDMLFNPNGYTGPSGQNLVSMAQYYTEQSGGSYTVEGEVYGWFQAPKTAEYYGGNNDSDNDSNPRSLVAAALKAAAENGVDLSQYDQEDIYDLDGDGNKREPDGLVDHLMIIHSGVGEEAGGGSLGADAIWSHRSNLAGVYVVPGTSTSVPYWGGMMGAYDYTIMPEDGATGVFAHEYGHDLGLPDEYDTIYSGGGEPIEYWSIMSSGSWAGTIPGTEPTGFSPYAKQYFQQTVSGNWLNGKTFSLNDLKGGGATAVLDQASTKGTNDDVVRIDLPDKTRSINAPASGSYEYYGGTGDEIDHSMAATVDLTGATSATLDYDTWFQIEENWDYAMVQVSTDGGATWQSLSTPNTNSDLVSDGYPAIYDNLPGYTGSSNGWIHESIDLSAYAGQVIQLQFRYMTDWGASLEGFFVDNIVVAKDGAAVLSDGAESSTPFRLNGFAKHTGKTVTKHYYLVEWRNHSGVDEGLAHIKRGQSIMSNDPGMLIWYVDESYNNNWVGMHPGRGFLGVVDSHQNVHHWGGNIAQGELAGTRYQIYDAPFSLVRGSDLDVYYGQGYHLYNAAKEPVAVFDDSQNYWSPSSIYSGLKLPSYGLKIQVLEEAADRSTAKIRISAGK